MPFVTDSLSCSCLLGGRLFCNLEQEAPKVPTHPQILGKRATAVLYDWTSKRWYLSPCERYSRWSNWEKAYPLLQEEFCMFQWEETITSSKVNLSFWEKGRMRWSRPAIFSIYLSFEMMIVLAASSCKMDCKKQSLERAKHGMKELNGPLKIKR